MYFQQLIYKVHSSKGPQGSTDKCFTSLEKGEIDLGVENM